MRKDYDHLTGAQRRQLERAVVILREEFAKAIKGKGWTRTRQGRILKIILYGSMARGKPVRDLSTGYRSDFDLLVVVNHPDLADDDWWYGAKDGLDLEASLGAVRYPYNLVVHDLTDVNDQLHRGRPFFVDVNRDGIILYEYEPKELAKPGNLSDAEKLEEAKGHFEQWYPSSLPKILQSKSQVRWQLGPLPFVPIHTRHAERVSASMPHPSVPGEAWTLKQVQGDDSQSTKLGLSPSPCARTPIT